MLGKGLAEVVLLPPKSVASGGFNVAVVELVRLIAGGAGKHEEPR